MTGKEFLIACIIAAETVATHWGCRTVVCAATQKMLLKMDYFHSFIGTVFLNYDIILHYTRSC